MAAVLISRRDEATAWIAALHDRISAWVAALDGGAVPVEQVWTRDGGGGGVSRSISGGTLLERGGFNRSAVSGTLPAATVAQFGGHWSGDSPAHFFATGVSLVLHPWNPHVPTVHLNVRYFELSDADGTVHDAWFGGGTDLTPFQPYPGDFTEFHRALQTICDRADPSWYARFKERCDRYFINAHRGDEARGIGGIFFDHLRPADHPDGWTALQHFANEVGESLAAGYGPMVRRRRQHPVSERLRRFQLLRRGRYVEFNLLHDRGTLFGLRTGARIESVLMSLPPLAAWDDPPEWEPGSDEAALLELLVPRAWV